jgi:hypothetical protein
MARSCSIYLIVHYSSVNTVSGTMLGLGIVNAVWASTMVVCYKRQFWLKLYVLVIGLIEIAQIVLASLFMVPAEQQDIIDAIDPPADLRGWLEDNLSTSGYVLIAIVAFQLVALFFVMTQICATTKSFDEEFSDSAALLSAGSDFGYGNRQGKLITSGDRFNALADEGLTAAATDRARSKYASYYDKYVRS